MTASDGAGLDREAVERACVVMHDAYERVRATVTALLGHLTPPADGVEVREEWGVRRIDGRERLWTCDDERDAQSWVSDNNATSGKARLEVVHRTLTTTSWEPQP